VQSSSQVVITVKPTPSFLRIRCPSCHPTNGVEALKGTGYIKLASDYMCPRCGKEYETMQFTATVPEDAALLLGNEENSLENISEFQVN